MKTPLSALDDPALLRTGSLIDGRWPEPADRFDVTDPATGQLLLQVANHGAVEAEAAIAAAHAALPAWRGKTALERHAVLMRWYQLLHQHADDLARIMTAEQGSRSRKRAAR